MRFGRSGFLALVFAATAAIVAGSVDGAPAVRAESVTASQSLRSDPVCHLVINEVDYDNVGTDDREFVEVFNGTNAAADLTNIAVVLVNGADNNEYSRVALAGSLAPAH